jgi:diadenosine tetraphosphatase ApaH/serine/threonine PP2A family protein phosphatase
VVSVGDLVDRGSKPTETVKFFRDSERGGLCRIAIKGNHEHKHLRGSKGEVRLALSQQIARKQFGDAYQEALAYFESMPYFLELPEAIVVHGGLDPDPSIPLSAQLADVLTGTQRGEFLLKAKYNRPWYEVYSGQKPIIFGHVDFLNNGNPFIFQERAYGLDTGCVFGRRLTGLLLPCFTIVSVPSRSNHWLDVRRKFLPPRPTRRLRRSQRPPVVWDDASEYSLARLISWASSENHRLLEWLQLEVAYDSLSEREKSLAYAELASKSPAASLLHLARQGRLDPAFAKRAIKHARTARELSHLLGLE